MRIGVDIGGSGVRAGRVGEDGIEGALVREALADRDVGTVVAAVTRAVEALGGAEAVGVGVPGFVRDGVVLGSPNFPGWHEVDLRSALHASLGVPVFVGNDANVAALGVWAERGATEELVLLTLGTGVGGGVVTGGRLLVGARGTGAELGHIHVAGDRPCGCGGRGCLETWCGTAGLIRVAAERGHPVQDGASVVAAAEAGEPWAVRLLDEAAEHLGKGLVTLVNIFNPDVVVIAGGLAAAARWLRPAEGWMRTHGVPPSARHVRVAWEGRADRWAILGAAVGATSLDER